MRRAALVLALAACGPKHGRDEARPGMPWDKAGVDWQHPPAPAPDPVYAPPVPETFALDNGVQVVMVPNHRLPLVSIRVVVGGAGARDDGDDTGLAALTADLLDEGAGELDAVELPRAVERLGAHLDTAVAEDVTVVWLDTLASTLDDSLGLLADVVLRPRFEKADVERVRADQIEDLKLRPQEPRRVANLIFDQLVYGDHPYGRPVSGYVSTVSALTADDIRAFWKKHYLPAQTTIVVAGDVERAGLEAALADRFGAWTGTAPAAAAPPALGEPPAPGIAFVDRPKAAQSVVMIGRPGVSTADPDYFAREVVNTAYGGSFASRLNHRIREELGYTYGIYSAFWRGEWGGSWSASTSLETEVTVAGIQEALALLDEARTKDLPADELAKTRQLMVRAMPQDFETDTQIAGAFSALVSARLPLDWYQGWADGVRAISAAEARAAAAASWDQLVIVVVGDWKAIGKDLEALGLPITRYDADGRVVK